MKYPIGVVSLITLTVTATALAQDAGGQQEALRWERAKDAAAVRQAHVEAAQPPKTTQVPVIHTMVPESTKAPGTLLWERAKMPPPAHQTKEATHTAAPANAVVAKTHKVMVVTDKKEGPH
jgi:hypothetical protein